MKNLSYAIVSAIGTMTMAAVYLITKLTPVPRKNKSSKKTLTGVANIGNTCFISSSLQALSVCRGVDGWLESILDRSLSIKHLLAYELAHAFKVLNNKSVESDHTYNPRNLLRTLLNNGWVIPTGEQDAFEFFHVLMETLNDENLNKSSANPLPLFDAASLDKTTCSDTGSYGRACGNLPRALHQTNNNTTLHPFRGRLYNQLICKECLRKTPAKYDSFDSISLHLVQKQGLISLRDMLSRFAGVEVVGEMMCGSCMSKGDFYKKTSFAKLPSILCLQIQRTVWTQYGPSKRGDHVLFPDLLDMSLYLSLSNRGGGDCYRGIRTGGVGGKVKYNGGSRGCGDGAKVGDGGYVSGGGAGLSMADQFKTRLVSNKEGKKVGEKVHRDGDGRGDNDGGGWGDEFSGGSNKENSDSGNVKMGSGCLGWVVCEDGCHGKMNVKDFEQPGKMTLNYTCKYEDSHNNDTNFNNTNNNNTNFNNTNNNNTNFNNTNNNNTNFNNTNNNNTNFNNTNNNDTNIKNNNNLSNTSKSMNAIATTSHGSLNTLKFPHRLYGGSMEGVSMWKALNFYSHVSHLSLKNVGGVIEERKEEVSDVKHTRKVAGKVTESGCGNLKVDKLDGNHVNPSCGIRLENTYVSNIDLSNVKVSVRSGECEEHKFYPEKQFLSPSKNDYPPNDDLQSLVQAYKQDSYQANTNGHSYRLMSVIVHLGTVTSGHFIAYKRATSRLGVRFPNRWFLTTDELVRPVSADEVFSSPAYMLIYEQI